MNHKFQSNALSKPSSSTLATNSVLRNTFILLGLTFLFSAITAGVAMVMNAPPIHPGFALVGYFALLFLVRATAQSAMGLITVFLFTGFMGFTLGPMLNMYIHAYSNGVQLIATALGGTGLIFFALSGYAMTTKKDFSYMGGFLFVGLMVVLGFMILSLFINMPILQLALSAAIVLLMSGFILFDVSRIIAGGERNYIMATVSLYVSLLNLFIHLLNILAAFSGRRN